MYLSLIILLLYLSKIYKLSNDKNHNFNTFQTSDYISLIKLTNNLKSSATGWDVGIHEVEPTTALLGIYPRETKHQVEKVPAPPCS